MYALIGVAMIAFIYFISGCITNKQEQRIQNAVTYCESEDSNSLLETLCVFHDSDNMPPECVIGIAEEWKLALNIIDDFKADLASSFFRDRLPLVRRKNSNKVSNYIFLNYVLSNIDFFSHYMCSYLLKSKKSIDAGYKKKINNPHETEYFPIVFYKLLLISYIHSYKMNISGYTESDFERIRLDLRWKREYFRRNDFQGPYVPYTGNDPDLGHITHEYVVEKALELGLFTTDVLKMINQKRENAGIKPVYEDEII